MSILEYLLVFLSAAIGGGLAFFIRLEKDDNLKLALSFTGAFILGITIMHILPSVFEAGTAYTGIWILLGFLLQILLEQLSQGVEHGHIHSHKKATNMFAIQILLGLSIHAFLEGFPLSNYHEFHHHHHGHDHGHGINYLLYGIVFHKLPAAFALGVLLLRSGYTKAIVLGILLVFALMSPAGAWVASHLVPNQAFLNSALALVAGSFLHIATTIIFESDGTNSHHISRKKMLTIIIGFGVALLTHL